MDRFDRKKIMIYANLARAVLVALISIPLTLIVVGIGTWIAGMFVLGAWAVYRIARGWLRLKEHQPAPA